MRHVSVERFGVEDSRILCSIFSYSFRETEFPDSESKTGTGGETGSDRASSVIETLSSERTFIVSAFGVVGENGALDGVGDGVRMRADAGRTTGALCITGAATGAARFGGTSTQDINSGSAGTDRVLTISGCRGGRRPR